MEIEPTSFNLGDEIFFIETVAVSGEKIPKCPSCGRNLESPNERTVLSDVITHLRIDAGKAGQTVSYSTRDHFIFEEGYDTFFRTKGEAEKALIEEYSNVSKENAEEDAIEEES